MSEKIQPADFFALEAGEYLERLAALAATAGGPPPDDFVRFSRALRGSALMANQPSIVQAAGGLEALARAHREGKLVWDAGVAERTGQAVEDLKGLVRRAREWTAADGDRAEQLAATLEQLAGRRIDARPIGRPAAPHSPAADEMHVGVRAFVAREGALIASALDRAAQALKTTPTAKEPLHMVLRRMQSLRGLAALADLTPLPELLDGLELAASDLTRMYAPPPGVSDVFAAAAQALTRVSREVADQGRPRTDSEEAQRFTDLLLRAFAMESDVVPIADLAPDGADAIVTRGTAPAGTTSLGPVELVGHGEYLCQCAEELRRAESPLQRDLRLYGLVGTLRSAGDPAGTPLDAALAEFGDRARHYIATGEAARSLPLFCGHLLEAGGALRQLSDGGTRDSLAQQLRTLAGRLTPVAPTAAPDEIDLPVVPIEELAPAEPLPPEPAPMAEFPRQPPPLTPAAPSPAPAAAAPGHDALERGFARYAKLAAEAGHIVPSLATLLAPAAAPAAAAPAPMAPPASPPPPATTPRVAAPPTAAEPDVVDIGTLLLRGDRALERAEVLRRQLLEALAGGHTLADLRPLLEELLDLVPLARERAS